MPEAVRDSPAHLTPITRLHVGAGTDREACAVSYYAANVVWQSADGTWSIGFHPMEGCNGECYDEDGGDETHEWCREADESRFDWVSVGHPTQDAAIRSWHGANPGTHDVYAYTPGYDPASHVDDTRSWAADFDDMAARLYESEQDRLAQQRGGRGGFGLGFGGYRSYNGPPKFRTLAAMQKEHNALVQDGARLLASGRASGMHTAVPDIERKVVDRLAGANPTERAAFEKADASHRAALRTILAEGRERRATENADALRRRHSAYRPSGYFSREDWASRQRREAARDEAEAIVEQVIADADKAAARREARTRQVAAASPPVTAPRAPKKAAPKKAAAPAARRKTTAKSTAGSFATQTRAEAPVALAAAATTKTTTIPAAADDPWAPLPGQDL